MSDASEVKRPWWTYMNGYHWYVFALAAMGWLFDTMDGMIFTASRPKTIEGLMPAAMFVGQNLTPREIEAIRTDHAGYVTALFLLGWATGGLIFGVVGDRWGRAKTMALTIFIYAAFTGFSGLAQDWIQFGICRFLTGLGVGGEFAAGAALVAEVMPEKSRAQALGMLQSLSAVGNIMGALLFWYIEPMFGWRWLYAVGAFPALLAVVVRAGLKEPEKWVAAKKAAAEAGSSGAKPNFGRMSEMFTIPLLRRNTFVGLGLAIAGVIGLWGAGFWSPELINKTLLTVEDADKEKLVAVMSLPDTEWTAALGKLDDSPRAKYVELVSKSLKPGEKVSDKEALASIPSADRKARMQTVLQRAISPKEKTKVTATALVLQQIGAFFGMFAFSLMAARFGRKPSFLIVFILGWMSVILTFYTFQEVGQIYYLWPILGFGTLAPFGGYALYFPELYPTRLRTTGTGFCYNVGRYFAILGPLTLAKLAGFLDGKFETPGFRIAAILVSSSYFIGMVALIWAPETVNQPLPEDERVAAH